MKNKTPRFSTKSLLAAAALALIAVPAEAATYTSLGGDFAPPGNGTDVSNFTLSTTESLEINALVSDGYTDSNPFQLTGTISATVADNVIRKTGDGVAILKGLNYLGGTVFVDAGGLGISALNPLSYAKITVADGATVTAFGVDIPTLGDVTLAGTFVSASGTNTVGTLILSDYATVMTDVGLGVTTLTLAQKTLTITGAGNLTVTTSNNAKDIIKSGTGTAALGTLTLGDNANFNIFTGALTAGSLDLDTKSLIIGVDGAANFTATSTDADANINKSGTGTAAL
ncbi:MAG: hypothetical protein ACKO3A_09495, partial [Opitutia bacterium]